MKKIFSFLFSLGAFAAFAQTPPTVPIHDIKFVSPSDLANCTDTSQYYNDTVRTIGVVVVDGGLVEVPSGSVQGGFRPFMYIADTAVGTTASAFKGIEVLASYSSGTGLVAHPVATQVVAGDIVEVIGRVGMFANNTQLEILNFNSLGLLAGSQTPPQPAVVSVGALNNNNRVNQLETGEQWEGSFVEIQNVTVVNVDLFSGGSRVSFDVVDAQGNRINVSDRFIAQKLPSHTPVNPESPYAVANGGPGNGTFSPPTVGAFYNSIRGIILHSRNGCLGGNGRGYELNPFDSTHYDLGASPPFVENVTRTPLVPNATQNVEIDFTAYDLDGTITDIKLYYSGDSTQPLSAFTSVTPQLIPGTTDEYNAVIPAFPNGSFVRYYIEATDNDNNVTLAPFGAGSTSADFFYYTVRPNGLIIPDIQFALDNGNSPYTGQSVTVTGVVTASIKVCDLGFVYIQDPDFNEWSGVALVGNPDLTNLFRDEEVTVTGMVQENFGFTQINVTSFTKTGNKRTVNPVVVSPNMPAMYASGEIEKYEGMLLRMENPNGKIFISEPRRGNFGDYLISTDTANGLTESTIVLAGRDGNSRSSLYVSVVNDSVWATQNGQMMVPVVVTDKSMEFDAIDGVLFFGFGEYRLLPRANDDFINPNFTLDSLDCRPLVSVRNFEGSADVRVFPNPASGFFNVEIADNGNFRVLLSDLNGRNLRSQNANNGRTSISVENLPEGMYILRVVDNQNGLVVKTAKVLVKK
ncbi:MAG: T9SS C-terminal target domain-containing protein [Flavobacteriales bacterium]|nr:MAG: T9SS C-terminal target domain-containing protein [Flavobacteriales bacterium]